MLMMRAPDMGKGGAVPGNAPAAALAKMNATPITAPANLEGMSIRIRMGFFFSFALVRGHLEVAHRVPRPESIGVPASRAASGACRCPSPLAVGSKIPFLDQFIGNFT